MNLPRLLTLAFVLVVPATAQNWTSPDGFLTVSPPTSNLFDKLPDPPPPFLSLWVSHDESMKFGVMKTPIPPGIKLIQASAEQGLAEEIGGEVTRLPTVELYGKEAWTMTAIGPSLQVTQSLVRHDGFVYKVMAVVLGDAANSDRVDQFINSLSITRQAMDKTQQNSTGEPDKDPADAFNSHNLSKMIGGIGTLLAIGLLIYAIARRKTPSES